MPMQALLSITQKIKALTIIVFIVMGGLLGIDIHLPSFLHIMAFMNSDTVHMERSVSLYLAGMGGSLLFFGPLSDKYGRRPIVIFGLCFISIASFSSIFTHHIIPFLLTRFCQGMGAGACAGLGRTMGVDLLRDKTLPASVLPCFTAIIGLSPLIGPVLGGYLQSWFGWQANFVFLGCFFIFLFGIYSLFCPETNQYINKKMGINKALLESYLELFKDPMFMASTLICGIAMSASIIYATLSPFIFQTQYHLSPVAYGWVTASVSIGIILGRFSNVFLIKRFGDLGTVKIGIFLMIFSGVWLIIFNSNHWIGMKLILIGVFIVLYSQTFLTTNTMQMALRPHNHKRGLAGSLFGSFQMGLTSLGSLSIGVFSCEPIVLLSLVYLFFGLINYFIFVILKKKQLVDNYSLPHAK